MTRPDFRGETKTRLVSPEARRAVGAGVGRFLRQLFASNPAAAEAVARAATKKAE